MASSTPPVLTRLTLAVVLSLLAGVVLAGLTFPLIGGVGLIGKAASDDFFALPATLDASPLAQSSRVLDKDGKLLATFFLENRVPVSLAAIPKAARAALVAIEDSRFYAHNGVDVKGTLRALARNSSAGGIQQGGSTLTQQYVKNILIENSRGDTDAQKAAIARTSKRKLQEARYALQLEKTMTKDQILEGYLNIAYYSNGVYGIGTAANHYFGIPVQRLDLAQSALLAGMVQNPSRYDPTNNPLDAVKRRNVVLQRMAELGDITPSEAAVARKEPLSLHITSVSSGCEAPGIRAPFFCDYVRRYLEDSPAAAVLGATRQERQERLLAGGLTIRTTLDPKVQAAAQTAVDQQLPADDPFGAAAVADTVEPGTGAVRAMAVNRTFGVKDGQTKVNYAIGETVGFQAGSTFKAFVLARALQLGISPSLTLYSPQRYCPKAFPYVADDGGCGPKNAGDSESGTFNMAQATWDSVNTYFIQLVERTGLATPPALAESLGVRQVDGSFAGTSLERVPSFVLGTAGVSPLAMTAAYATFAADGLFCPPNPIISIQDRLGADIGITAEPCVQALDSGVAHTVTSLLRGVIDGPAPHTGAGASIGRPAAGKTGTTDDSKAAWFIGYTPQLATAVWVGKPTPTSMTQVILNGRYYRAVYGGSLPAAIWKQLMRAALEGVPSKDFPAAGVATGSGAQVPVPDVTGQPVAAAADELRAAGFGVTVGAQIDAGPLPAGAVAKTLPAAGLPADAGSTVTIIASNGKIPPPQATPTATPVAPTAAPSVSPSPTKSPQPTPSGTAASPSPTFASPTPKQR